MIRQRTYYPILALVAAFVLHIAAFAEELHKEIKRGDEKEVKVKLESAIGMVNICKGDESRILVMDMRTNHHGDLPFVVEYKSRDRVGTLLLNWNPEGQNSWGWREGDRWDIQLTNAVPLSIDANFGVGKVDFDLSGLDVKALKITTGASSSIVSFGTPNKSVIENLRIESGVSKFVGEKLGNANFRHMTFDGGVGSYYLDFNGAITRDVEAHVKVGLGTVTIVLPPEIGAKVVYDDSWLSKFSIDRDFSQTASDTYLSSNYHDAKIKISVYIESGLGSVKVKRRN